MTDFLASVSSPGEAQTALAAAADIIDLKDASKGALGALDDTLIAAILDRVGGMRPLSATIGDLPMDAGTLIKAVRHKAALGVDFVKIGFPDDENRPACIEALGPLAAQGLKLVAVFFADQPFDPALITHAKSAGFTGVMLDTAQKSSGCLMDCQDVPKLQAFVSKARALGLLTGLAGSLKPAHIPELLPLKPDYLGFRGALCGAGERTGTLDLKACLEVRRLIPAFRPLNRDIGEAANIVTNP